MAYSRGSSMNAICETGRLLAELNVGQTISMQLCRDNSLKGSQMDWSKVENLEQKLKTITEDLKTIPLSARPLTVTSGEGAPKVRYAGIPVDVRVLGATLDSFETVDRALEGTPADRTETSSYFLGPRHNGGIQGMENIVAASSPTEAMMLHLASKIDLSRTWAITPDMDLGLEDLDLRSLHDWEKHDVEQVFQSACVVLDPHLGWNAMYDNEPGF